jgi:hypothetical protein
MKRYQDFRYPLRGELALPTAGSHACRGKAPCPDGQRHRRDPATWHMVFGPAKARRAALRGDRTGAGRVDKSFLPNRSYPPEDPCFKLRGSGKAGVALLKTVAGAAFRDSRRECRARGISRHPRERFAGHHSSKLNSVYAPTLGLGAPFFRAATTIRNADFTQPLPRLGRSVYLSVPARPRSPSPLSRAARL